MKNNKGITLIALVITIIVMLILVGVTITVAMQGGLFNTARKAATGTEAEKEKELQVASGIYEGKTLEEWAAGEPAEPAIKHTITKNLTNITYSGPDIVADGTDTTITLTADEGYYLPTEISIDGEKVYYFMPDYPMGTMPIGNYKVGFGKTTVSIPLGEVKSDVTISAVADVITVPIINFTVDCSVYGGIQQWAAPQGMTWEQFVGSVYDTTSRYSVENGAIYMVWNDDKGVVQAGSTPVSPDSEIASDVGYSVYWIFE